MYVSNSLVALTAPPLVPEGSLRALWDQALSPPKTPCQELGIGTTSSILQSNRAMRALPAGSAPRKALLPVPMRNVEGTIWSLATSNAHGGRAIRLQQEAPFRPFGPPGFGWSSLALGSLRLQREVFPPGPGSRYTWRWDSRGHAAVGLRVG